MALTLAPQMAQAQSAEVVHELTLPTPDSDLIRELSTGTTLDIENDHLHDGKMVSASGAHEAAGDIFALDAVKPNNGKEADETVVLINGIMTDLALQRRDMQALANTGKNVVGIHNATAGMARDLAQCVQDKLSFKSSENPATLTAVDVLESALEKGEGIHMVGHSQGGLILSSAVSIVKHKMVASGMSEAQAEAALGEVRITTFGAAARNYPDGPAYTHVINKADAVPMGTGLGLMGRPGRGANVITVDEKKEAGDLPSWRDGIQNFAARYVDQTTHGPQDIYFQHAPWNTP